MSLEEFEKVCKREGGVLLRVGEVSTCVLAKAGKHFDAVAEWLKKNKDKIDGTANVFVLGEAKGDLFSGKATFFMALAENGNYTKIKYEQHHSIEVLEAED